MGANELADKLKESTGTVLRELREQRGYSQIDVSRIIGRTTSWLSMLEAGKTTTTFNILLELLNIYECTLSYFFESVEEKSRDTSDFKKNIAVVHVNEWQPLSLIEGMTYFLPPFKEKLQGGKLDFTPVVLKAGCSSGVVRHQGEEILYMLKGELELLFYEDLMDTPTGEPLKLKQGDAVHFYTSIRHEGKNHTDTDVRFLVVRSSKVFP